MLESGASSAVGSARHAFDGAKILAAVFVPCGHIDSARTGGLDRFACHLEESLPLGLISLVFDLRDLAGGPPQTFERLIECWIVVCLPGGTRPLSLTGRRHVAGVRIGKLLDDQLVSPSGQRRVGQPERDDRQQHRSNTRTSHGCKISDAG